MPWKYPTVTRNTARKLGLIFSMEIVLITGALLVAIHCTWHLDRWRLLNGHNLEWQLGLFRNWAGANCDAMNEPGFHALCMAVFKNTFGTVGEVRDFICSLDHAKLKIEPEFADDARVFSSSCSDMNRVYVVSTICFSLMIVAAILSAAVFYAILRLAYKQFKSLYKMYYWISFGFQVFTCVLILAILILYPIAISSLVPGLFHYVNDDDPGAAPIQRIPNAGSIGTGVVVSIILLLIDIVISVLILYWVPIAGNGDSQPPTKVKGKRGETVALLPKKQKKQQSQQQYQPPSPSTSSFWAYMPEVFQPDVYVAEYGGPQLVGYSGSPSVTTVTRTITDADGNTITEGGYVEPYPYQY